MSNCFLLIVLSSASLFAIGCTEAKYYPVRGKIVDAAGQPVTELAGAQLSFEAVGKNVSAVAEVRPDASFAMTTEANEDGCVPGEHRVCIARVFLSSDRQQPAVIDPKYESYETSGLKVNVEKKTNDVVLEVERVQQ